MKKSKRCHKCNRVYIGWRCPTCYGKSHKSSGRSRNHTAHTFDASCILARSATITIHTDPPATDPGEPMECYNCGTVTREHFCPQCNADVWKYGVTRAYVDGAWKQVQQDLECQARMEAAWRSL